MWKILQTFENRELSNQTDRYRADDAKIKKDDVHWCIFISE